MTEEQIGKLIDIVLNQGEQVARMEERELILHRLLETDDFMNKSSRVCIRSFDWSCAHGNLKGGERCR